MISLKNNKQGFSIVEVILIIVIIGVIGSVGWYVWQSKNKTDKTLDNAVSSQNEPQKTIKSTPTPNVNFVAKNASKLQFSYVKPNGWSFTESTNPEVPGYYGITYVAPGTTKNSGGMADTIKTGAEIVINKSNDDTYKSIDELFAKAPVYKLISSKDLKNIQIDGVRAVQFNMAYEVPDALTTLFYIDSNLYTIAIEKAAYNGHPEYLNAYNDLISSIKF
ncbi:MAG: hypothetical protein M0R39_17720 [Prolixibacteraceae bacterium]|nr:hypothetical protein [Prolixibacteraceae bacterium]